MATLVEDCPRCSVRSVTFDVIANNGCGRRRRDYFETFCVCRKCSQSTVFILSASSAHTFEPIKPENGINPYFTVDGILRQMGGTAVSAPDHLPENVKTAFEEGAACMAAGCFNAGAAMFRLCLDLATKPMLPEKDESGLNGSIRRSLGLRLNWLFDNGHLDKGLCRLAACVKDNGNDGVHDGTLSKIDAEDLQDFAIAFLERVYTEPKRLELAELRRNARHNPTPSA